MNPLAWFRYSLTGRELIRTFVLLFFCLASLYVVGHADDLDGDGYDDSTGAWVGYGGGGSPDSDGDGLTDYDESNIFWTNPSMPDTDGDGEWDGAEIANGYNPLDSTSNSSQSGGTGMGGWVDSDADGLSDTDETSIYFTSPYTWDTDGDGHSDGVEVTGGFNPLDPTSNSSNTGGGGGTTGGYDTDGDGLSDEAEVSSHLTNPLLVDTDADGVNDYTEVNGTEIWVQYEYYSHTDYDYNSETGEYTPRDVFL